MPAEAEPAILTPEDELQLVERCQQGDTAAFNDLVTRYRQRAFAMIYNMVRNEQDAWDLTQDGFLKAWKSITRFQGQSSFFTWLYRILTNITIDWLRKKKIESGAELDDSVGVKVAPGAVTAPHAELAPATSLSDKEIRARIDEAIAKLSPEHRTVITLREIEGLDYQEIAEATGASLGTVMSR